MSGDTPGLGPPDGATTLVFTDMVGSTSLAQVLGDRFLRLPATHNDISRDA